MNKREICFKIIIQLEADLKVAEIAAEQARNASIDDQSVAETQYDTLAIESAYLAEGQSKRIAEIKHAIALMQELKLPVLTSDSEVVLGACVKVVDSGEQESWYFVAPVAGGLQFNIEGRTITVITPQSPIGNALIGKVCDDDFELRLGAKIKTGYIEQLF